MSRRYGVGREADRSRRCQAMPSLAVMGLHFSNSSERRPSVLLGETHPCTTAGPCAYIRQPRAAVQQAVKHILQVQDLTQTDLHRPKVSQAEATSPRIASAIHRQRPRQTPCPSSMPPKPRYRCPAILYPGLSALPHHDYISLAPRLTPSSSITTHRPPPASSAPPPPPCQPISTNTS
jgi:hypothetical protein